MIVANGRGWRRVAVVVVLTVLGRTTAAQEGSIGPGVKVVLRGPEVALRLDGKEVPTGWNCLVYRVEKVAGEQLYVVWDRGAGWVERGGVAPLSAAVETYTKALASDEGNAAWAYLWRAQAKRSMGDSAAARTDLDQALKRNPRDVAALVERGRLLVEAEDLVGALADLDMAVRLAPADPWARVARAVAHDADGDDEKALADLDEAIRLDPGNTEAHQERGLVLGKLDRSEEGIAALDEAVRLVPHSARAFLYRARLRYDRKELDWALSDLNEVVGLDPDEAGAYTLRAYVRTLLADDAGAAADYRRALELKPEDPTVLNDCAFFLAACPDATQRDGRRAIELARKAMELTAQQDADILDTLAVAYAEAGKFQEARGWVAKAIELTDDADEREVFESHRTVFENGKPFRIER